MTPKSCPSFAVSHIGITASMSTRRFVASMARTAPATIRGSPATGSMNRPPPCAGGSAARGPRRRRARASRRADSSRTEGGSHSRYATGGAEMRPSPSTLTMPRTTAFGSVGKGGAGGVDMLFASSIRSFPPDRESG